MCGHILVNVGEIAVVIPELYGHTVDDGFIHLFGRHSPLLSRVILKNIFIDILAGSPYFVVAAFHKFQHRYLLPAGKGFSQQQLYFFGCALFIQQVERQKIKRNRHKLAVDFAKHPVLIGEKLRESLEEFKYLFVLRVKDMWPVAVNQYPVVVGAVVHIAGNMRAPFTQKHTFTAIGKFSGGCRTGKTAANDKTIVHFKLHISAHIKFVELKKSIRGGDMDFYILFKIILSQQRFAAQQIKKRQNIWLEIAIIYINL